MPTLELNRELSPATTGNDRAAGSLSPGTDRPPLARSRWRHLAEVRNGLAARGLGLFPSWPSARADGAFGILMYHRVVPLSPGVVAPTWNVPPARFRTQLSGLLRRGYRPWALRKVIDCHRAGQIIPAKTFVVTFDDGYENVYRHAFPILRDLQIPATVFLATGFLDSPSPFPFDVWSGAGSLDILVDTWKPLTTAHCRKMLDSGLIELGAHTHNHEDYRGRPDDLRCDLALAVGTLRARFGLCETTFAFPYGYGCRRNDGPALAEAAKDVGVLCALTTDEELVSRHDDCFNWARLTATNYDTAASLEAKLNGSFSDMRRAWKRLRGRTQPQSARQYQSTQVMISQKA